MTEEAEVHTETGNYDDDGDACAVMALEETAPTGLNSADIIPEAAMKCGILPLEDISLESDQFTQSFVDMSENLVVQSPSAPEVVTPSLTSPAPEVSVPDPSSPASAAATGSAAEICAGCGRAITERYLLRALDRSWHEDCLRCSCCDCRLGEVGSTLFTRSNLILCRRDYLRLFGTTGFCAACSKLIPAFEMIMKAKNNVYHLECFACQRCYQRFCIGDRFYLFDNKILCEYDFVEQRSMMNMTPPVSATVPPSSMPPRTAAVPASSATVMKRHHQHQQQQFHPHHPHLQQHVMDGCGSW